MTNPRAAMYRLLEEPFRFPESPLIEKFISGQWQEELNGCFERFDYDLQLGSDLSLNATIKEYEVEFISLFEVGMGGAPCPLHSGHFGKERMITMEEVLRFYRFFDYHPDRSANRFPDHINFELQFMALLADQEAKAEADGGDILSPLLAQRDFATRNLASWLPDLSQLIDARTSIKFFANAAQLLSAFVAQDSVTLAARAKELQPA